MSSDTSLPNITHDWGTRMEGPVKQAVAPLYSSYRRGVSSVEGVLVVELLGYLQGFLQTEVQGGKAFPTSSGDFVELPMVKQGPLAEIPEMAGGVRVLKTLPGLELGTRVIFGLRPRLQCPLREIGGVIWMSQTMRGARHAHGKSEARPGTSQRIWYQWRRIPSDHHWRYEPIVERSRHPRHALTIRRIVPSLGAAPKPAIEELLPSRQAHQLPSSFAPHWKNGRVNATFPKELEPSPEILDIQNYVYRSEGELTEIGLDVDLDLLPGLPHKPLAELFGSASELERPIHRPTIKSHWDHTVAIDLDKRANSSGSHALHPL